MDDLLNEFLTETAENLSALDVELVKFERDPTDAAILGSIFRMMHTIKGTCGFLGLQRLETVAHAGENVLGKFRDGELKVTPHAVTDHSALYRPDPPAPGRDRTGRQRARRSTAPN